jgi:hypothetical protein
VRATSPMTNAPLANRRLLPNHALRSAIMQVGAELEAGGSGGSGSGLPRPVRTHPHAPTISLALLAPAEEMAPLLRADAEEPGSDHPMALRLMDAAGGVGPGPPIAPSAPSVPGAPIGPGRTCV